MWNKYHSFVLSSSLANRPANEQDVKQQDNYQRFEGPGTKASAWMFT